ncbi:MAG: hypothetical protein ACI853_001347, partial [Paracoccaceae bacterium]
MAVEYDLAYHGTAGDRSLASLVQALQKARLPRKNTTRRGSISEQLLALSELG